MYAAITDGLVGENTRYETGSLLSRSVHRMRAEVCLHTSLCLRAKCLFFSSNSEDPRVVSSFSHSQLVVVGCAPLQKLRVGHSHILSCPTLDARTRRFHRAAAGSRQKPGAGCRDRRIRRSFEEATLLRQGDMAPSGYEALLSTASSRRPHAVHAHDEFTKHRALGKRRPLKASVCVAAARWKLGGQTHRALSDQC